MNNLYLRIRRSLCEHFKYCFHSLTPLLSPEEIFHPNIGFITVSNKYKRSFEIKLKDEYRK